MADIIKFNKRNSVKELLEELLIDADNIGSIVLVHFEKDGTTACYSHANCKRRDMAYSSLLLAKLAMEE